MPENSQTDFAWAAGFLDGEGCLLLDKHKNNNKTESFYSYYPRIAVTQIYTKPLDKLSRMFQGNVILSRSANGNNRTLYRWDISGSQRCKYVLTNTLPYLLVKKDQALVLLEYIERVISRGSNFAKGKQGWGVLTPEEIAYRQKIVLDLRKLKSA